jgi:hypothetical protein
LLGLACAAISISLMAMPTAYYLRHRSVAEWMIYRFVVSSLAASNACLLLCAAYLTRKIVSMVLSDHSSARPVFGQLLFGRFFWLAPAGLLAVGVALVFPSFMQLVRTGATYEHWSRFIAMSCLVSCALILVVAKAFDYTLTLIAARLEYLRALHTEAVTPAASPHRGDETPSLVARVVP